MTESRDIALTFFKTAAAFRTWLERNHRKKTELWLGFYKTSSGKPSVTYKEALDQALCFGWIDGVRKRVDDISYVQRFSPRQRRSYWSQINTKRMAELIAQGLVSPAGQAAFDARDSSMPPRYSKENAPRELGAVEQQQFKATKKAWAFFQTTPPRYQLTCKWWVMSAVKPETRLRRLAQLIDASADERRVDLLTSPAARDKASAKRKPVG